MVMDFDFTPHGTLCLLMSLTTEAQTWVDDFIGSKAMRWAGAVVIEPRYVDTILNAIDEDGLTIHLNI